MRASKRAMSSAALLYRYENKLQVRKASCRIIRCRFAQLGLRMLCMQRCLACLSFLFLASSAFAQQLGRATLPDPPQQGTEWKIPAGVSSNLLSAVTALFQQGFPDPRGCEYREIEVEVSSAWGNQGVASTRGWVLPTPAGSTQSFAICWNGVIYPVNKVGKQVDLQAEAVNAPPLNRSRVHRAASEVSSVFLTNSLSTRVLLLLRYGETEVALKTWNGNVGPPLGTDAKNSDPDPYLEMAGDWAWALFDHAISAHMRGNTAIALASAHRLAEIRPRIVSLVCQPVARTTRGPGTARARTTEEKSHGQ
jgi:hypothetical protein